MKFYLKLALLVLFPLCGFAQDLNDAKTFKKTLALAQTKKRPVLLVINVVNPLTNERKIPENVGFKDQEVSNKIKDNFVVFETNRNDTSIRSILSIYKVTRFPAYLFMHPTRDVFHSDYGQSSTKHKYLAMLDKAMLLSKEKGIAELQAEYLKNPDDYGTLKELIQLRKKNGLTDNASLIEKYVQGLKIGDFNDYQTVLFILEAGPYSDGMAYRFANTNRKIIDSIYKKEPLQVRTAMNGAIINNTMSSAIKTKNRMRAQSAANFSRTTWNNDYLKGNKTYGSQMLYFYRAIKDTTSYFNTAVQHYDTYYMKIGADSIKKIETKEKKAMLDRMRPISQKNTVSQATIDSLIKANPSNMVRRETFLSSSPIHTYANDLNNIAYQFYQTGTKNLNYLTKAMLWSKRAIELNPMWGYYDTLAHVYYAMGIHSEAVATQKIAMDLAKKESNPEYLARTSKEYEKMKNKTL